MPGFFDRLMTAFAGGPNPDFLPIPPAPLDPNQVQYHRSPAFTGQARPAEWDATASAEAPELTGDTVHFVARENGTLLVDEDVPDGSVAALADEIELRIAAPYRARAHRNEGRLWTIGAHRISVATLPAELVGETIELTVVAGERQLLVDGEPVDHATPDLDRLGALRAPDFAARAERLDETAWAVEVSPL